MKVLDFGSGKPLEPCVLKFPPQGSTWRSGRGCETQSLVEGAGHCGWVFHRSSYTLVFASVLLERTGWGNHYFTPIWFRTAHHGQSCSEHSKRLENHIAIQEISDALGIGMLDLPAFLELFWEGRKSHDNSGDLWCFSPCMLNFLTQLSVPFTLRQPH